jgi:hypothetical protein
MTRFYDPSVQFLLQFDAEAGPGPQAAPAPAPLAAAPSSAGAVDADPEAPNVVSLDQFRKK